MRSPARPKRGIAGLLVVVAAVLVGVALAVSLGGRRGRTTVAPAATSTERAAGHSGYGHRSSHSVRLVERRLGRLASAVQDAAVARVGPAGVVLVGGLTSEDTSTDAVRVVTPTHERSAGRLPAPVHDAAAVRLGRSVYLFGGGDRSSQLDAILRIDRVRSVAGRLPAPSSDQAATVIGDTAYVVGGYTGSRSLDTVVAWHPGRPARVVAHLPSALRYAAVTAVGDTVVIAGGSLPNGKASDAVLGFVRSTGRVVRIGRLPAPTTHGPRPLSLISPT